MRGGRDDMHAGVSSRWPRAADRVAPHVCQLEAHDLRALASVWGLGLGFG